MAHQLSFPFMGEKYCSTERLDNPISARELILNSKGKPVLIPSLKEAIKYLGGLPLRINTEINVHSYIGVSANPEGEHYLFEDEILHKEVYHYQ